MRDCQLLLPRLSAGAGRTVEVAISADVADECARLSREQVQRHCSCQRRCFSRMTASCGYRPVTRAVSDCSSDSMVCHEEVGLSIRCRRGWLILAARLPDIRLAALATCDPSRTGSLAADDASDPQLARRVLMPYFIVWPLLVLPPHGMASVDCTGPTLSARFIVRPA